MAGIKRSGRGCEGHHIAIGNPCKANRTRVNERAEACVHIAVVDLVVDLEVVQNERLFAHRQQTAASLTHGIT